MSPHPPYHPSKYDRSELRRLLPFDSHEVLVSAFEEGLTDRFLNRWLVARKGDIKAAAAMLEKHINWRRGPGRPVDDSHHGVQVNLQHKKVFLQGLDRSGRPIVLGVGCRHRKFDCKDDALAFCTYALDTAVAIGDSNEDWDGKLTGVFDLRNLSMKNLDLTALQVMFELLQNHYPERLGRLFLYEAPMAFYAIWRAVSPFVDSVTKTKINFVFAKNAHDEFAKVFDLHLLPRELGGEGEWQPIEVAHRLAVEKVEARRRQPGKQGKPSTGVKGGGGEENEGLGGTCSNSSTTSTSSGGSGVGGNGDGDGVGGAAGTKHKVQEVEGREGGEGVVEPPGGLEAA